MNVITRKEAKSKNLNRFFTGRPCIYGHISERYISGVCVECSNIKNVRNRDSGLSRERERLRSPRRYIQEHDRILLQSAKRRSKKHNIECTITVEWIQERLDRGVCEATGIRFIIEGGKGHGTNPNAPSVDRRDSTLGYTPENTRVVILAFNMACGTWGEDVAWKVMTAWRDKTCV